MFFTRHSRNLGISQDIQIFSTNALTWQWSLGTKCSGGFVLVSNYCPIWYTMYFGLGKRHKHFTNLSASLFWLSHGKALCREIEAGFMYQSLLLNALILLSLLYPSHSYGFRFQPWWACISERKATVSYYSSYQNCIAMSCVSKRFWYRKCYAIESCAHLPPSQMCKRNECPLCAVRAFTCI